MSYLLKDKNGHWARLNTDIILPNFMSLCSVIYDTKNDRFIKNSGSDTKLPVDAPDAEDLFGYSVVARMACTIFNTRPAILQIGAVAPNGFMIPNNVLKTHILEENSKKLISNYVGL